jgi:hypothetical protein
LLFGICLLLFGFYQQCQLNSHDFQVVVDEKAKLNGFSQIGKGGVRLKPFVFYFINPRAEARGN